MASFLSYFTSFKKQVLLPDKVYSVYYPDFDAFKFAISSCLDQSHTTHKSALDSLLTLRFQSFDNINSIPC